MIREVIRLIRQAVRYSLRRRSLGLLFFLLVGGLLVAVVVGATFAAPVMIYPLL